MSRSVKSFRFIHQFRLEHRRWIRRIASELGYPKMEQQAYEELSKRFERRYAFPIFISEIKAILYGKPRPRRRWRRLVFTA